MSLRSSALDIFHAALDAADTCAFITHKFIRHQYNWFRPTDTRIKWFDLSAQDCFMAICDLIVAESKSIRP